MMEYKSLTKHFKVVGLKGNGSYENLGKEVPILAKQVVSRSNEIQNNTGIEIALFEPKRDTYHQEGDY